MIHMILKEKIQITWNPFKYIFLRFRTLCILFSIKKKKHLVADRGWPPSPFKDMFATIRFFLTPSLTLFITKWSHKCPFFGTQLNAPSHWYVCVVSFSEAKMQFFGPNPVVVLLVSAPLAPVESRSLHVPSKSQCVQRGFARQRSRQVSFVFPDDASPRIVFADEYALFVPQVGSCGLLHAA